MYERGCQFTGLEEDMPSLFFKYKEGFFDQVERAGVLTFVKPSVTTTEEKDNRKIEENGRLFEKVEAET